MSTAEFLQWAALLTIIEPKEREEQQQANSQSSF